MMFTSRLAANANSLSTLNSFMDRLIFSAVWLPMPSTFVSSYAEAPRTLSTVWNLSRRRRNVLGPTPSARIRRIQFAMSCELVVIAISSY